MPGAPHEDAARALLARASREATRPCISRQVLREYLAVTTRPQRWAQPLPLPAALADVASFQRAFRILEDGPAVTARLVSLCRSVPAS